MIVLAVVVAALATGLYGAAHRASSGYARVSDLSYAVLARPLILQASSGDEAVGSELAKLSSATRTSLLGDISSWASECRMIAHEMGALPVPAGAPRASSALARAMVEHGDFASEMLHGIDLALSSGSSPGALQALAEARQSFLAADASEIRAGRLLARAPGHAHLDAVHWPGGLLARMISEPSARTKLASDLSGAPALDLKPEVVLGSVWVNPPPETLDGTVGVIGPSSGITVGAVVANLGNADEKGVIVSAQLRASQSAGVHGAATRSVTVSLGAGDRRVVSFGPFRVSSGHSYVVTLVVGHVPGQTAGTGSTSASFPFVVGPL